VQLRVNRRVRQPAFGRLGDAEVDHLRHRHPVVQRNENVRRLDVAMDDPLLVRVPDGLANLDEQIEPFLGGEVGLVAIIGDLDAARTSSITKNGLPTSVVPASSTLAMFG
jgi:hypothetical protein